MEPTSRSSAAPWRVASAAAAVALWLASSGCSTAEYWEARRADALDVISFQVGYGLGAKARAGPLQAGALIDVGLAGLRGGALLGPADFWPEWSDTPAKVEVLGGVVGFDSFWGAKHRRGKDYVASHVGIVSLPCNLGESDLRSLREIAPDTFYNPWPLLSQLELAGGLGLTLRLGANPGELLDLLLGFLTLDPLSDDARDGTDGVSTYRLPSGFPFTWHQAVCDA